MKKIFIVIACVMLSLSASAQRASSSSSSFFSTEKVDHGMTFGIPAGLNLANVSASENDYSYSSDSRVSFHIGVIADIPLMQSLYVQTGLFLQNKGFVDKGEDGDYDYKQTAKPMYLEIPVLASYRYDFSDALQLQINAGPYFAYGVGGKIKEEYDGDSDEYDYFGSYDDDDSYGVKRFDMGVQFGAGLTFGNRYYLCVSYQDGLTYIADGADDNYSLKNKNLMVSIGYNF